MWGELGCLWSSQLSAKFWSVCLSVLHVGQLFTSNSLFHNHQGLVKQVNSIRTKMVDMSTEERGNSTAGGDPTTTPPPGVSAAYVVLTSYFSVHN